MANNKTNLTQTVIAFKATTGKTNTGMNLGDLSETIGTKPQIDASTLFATTITSTPPSASYDTSSVASGAPGAIQLVHFDLVPIGGTTYKATDFDSEAESSTSTTHSFAAKLTNDYQTVGTKNPKAGTAPFINNTFFSGSNLQFVPASFHPSYSVKLIDQDGDAVTSGDDMDWYFDYFSGVLFRQDGDNTTIPVAGTASIYIGKFISESLASGSSQNLQEVTDAGNSTTTGISVGSLTLTSAGNIITETADIVTIGNGSSDYDGLNLVGPVTFSGNFSSSTANSTIIAKHIVNDSTKALTKLTGSFTGSFTGDVDAFPFTGSAAISGSLTVEGEDGSIVASGGVSSSKTVHAKDIIQRGEVGNSRLTGSFSGSFTGPLTGTSSWAESSSHAKTASYVEASDINQPFTTITASSHISSSGHINANTYQHLGQEFVSSSTTTFIFGAGTGVALKAGSSGVASMLSISANTYAPFTSSTLLNSCSVSETHLTGSFTGSLTGEATGLSGTPNISVGTITNDSTVAASDITGSFTGSFTGAVTGTSSYTPNLQEVTDAGNSTTTGISVGSLTLTSAGNIITETADIVTIGNGSSDYDGLNLVGPVTYSGDFSASTAGSTITAHHIVNDSTKALTKLTGSFTGSFTGDGSDLTNLPGTAFPFTGSAAISGTLDLTGPAGSIVASGGVSSSKTVHAKDIIQKGEVINSRLTGSFSGSFAGDGSNLTNLPGTAFPFTGSAAISGTLDLTGPLGNITASGNISASGTGSFGMITSDRLVSHTGDVDTGLQFTSDTVDIEGANEIIGKFSTTKIQLGIREYVSGFEGTQITGSLYVSGAAAAITSSGDISSSGIGTFASLDISGDIDVDGTTNLDAVDIDGNVQLDGTFTVGANDQGYDVTLFGDTANKRVLWDTSTDHLKLFDDTKLVFGTGGADADYDGSIYWNQTDLVIDSESDLQLLSDVNVTGHITASGNISASGHINANTYQHLGTEFVSASGGTFIFGAGTGVALKAGSSGVASMLSISANTYAPFTSSTLLNSCSVSETHLTGSFTGSLVGALTGTSSFATVTAGLVHTPNISVGTLTNTSTVAGSKLTGSFTGSHRGIFRGTGPNLTQIGTTVGGTSITGSLKGNITLDTGSQGSTALGFASGQKVYFGGGGTTTAGAVVVLKSTGKWEYSNATSDSASTGSLGVALGTNTATDGVLINGFTKILILNNGNNGAIGDPVYLENENGRATIGPPTTDGNIVRIIGHLISGSTNSGHAVIHFNPSPDFIEHA